MLLSDNKQVLSSTKVAEPSSAYSADSAKQIEYLERIIAEKDKRLEDKDKLIENLETQLADFRKKTDSNQ